MVETVQPELVEKEVVTELHFPHNEMLASEEAIQKRNRDLKLALALGNRYRRKVKLVFATMEGHKQVETTIWSLTERNVILKGGKPVPRRCVIEVKLY